MTTSLTSDQSSTSSSTTMAASSVTSSSLPLPFQEELKKSPSAERLLRLAHQHHMEAKEKKQQEEEKEAHEFNKRDRSGSTGTRSSSGRSNRSNSSSRTCTSASDATSCSSKSCKKSSDKRTRGKRTGSSTKEDGHEINEDSSSSHSSEEKGYVLEDLPCFDDDGGNPEEVEEPLMKECCKEMHGQVEALLVQLRSVHTESKKKDELIKDLQDQISALQQLLLVSTAARGNKEATSQGLLELSSPSTRQTKENIKQVRDEIQYHNLSSISPRFKGDYVDDNSDVDEDSSVESSLGSTAYDENFDRWEQEKGEEKNIDNPPANKKMIDSECSMANEKSKSMISSLTSTTMLSPESSFQPLMSSPPTSRRESMTLAAATSEDHGPTGIHHSSCHSRSSLLSSASSSFDSAYSSYRSFGGVGGVVDEIQQWLFIEGGNLRDVKSLLKEYSKFCRRTLRIPVDRLAVAGMMLHPKVSAHVWKWEHHQKFTSQEVPPSAFEKPNYNPDEPFAVLMEGRAEEYRMKRPTTDSERNVDSHRQRQRRWRSSGRDEENEQNDSESTFTVPPSCSWFNTERYNDYLALPMMYQGKFVGAMAWSTKHRRGFTDDQIQVFKQSLAALSTVLRLHTHEIVQRSLTSRLEEAVASRTHDLAEANRRLIIANKKTDAQAKAQLQHFAMMSHGTFFLVCLAFTFHYFIQLLFVPSYFVNSNHIFYVYRNKNTPQLYNRSIQSSVGKIDKICWTGTP